MRSWALTLAVLAGLGTGHRAQAISPNFVSIYNGLIAGSCTPCHGKAPLLNRVPLHDYHFLLRSPLELVVPGNPDASGLLIALTRGDKKRMPPPESTVRRPTAQEIAVVRQWIAGGAPYSDGDAADARDTVKADPPEAYRKLLTTARPRGKFRVALPGGTNLPVSYGIGWGRGKAPLPTLIDFSAGLSSGHFFRMIFDKVYTDDASKLVMGTEELPLTCVHLDGQDNRYAGKSSPLTPDLILKFYLVANDYSCTGPVNHDPAQGKLGELWDTYLYFEVRDPSTMLPIDAKLRYRWNDFKLVFQPGSGG